MTDVLDLIDGAISDWETSPDAMRWGAESGGEEPQYKTGGWSELLRLINAERRPDPLAGARLFNLVTAEPYRPGSRQFAMIMPAICRWLEANGIVPKRVPIHAVPAVFRGWIYIDTYAWGADGPVVLNSLPKERTIRVPLIEPLPDALKPWWLIGDSGPIGRWYDERIRLGAMHSAYSRRLRSRRRRRRK